MKNNEQTIYPLLAKVGHKLPYDNNHEQAQALWEHFYDEDIQYYEMKRLSTLQDILDNNSSIDDLVIVTERRPYSLDYDRKREVLSDGSTKPHKTINDFKRDRGVVNTLRDKKKVRATAELVTFYSNRTKQGVRFRGSPVDDCTRHFCRALVQNVYPFKDTKTTYKVIARKLAEYNVTEDKLKNAKRNPFVANVIFNSSSNRSTVRKMLKLLGYESEDNYAQWLELLMDRGLSNPVTMFY